MVSGPVFNLLTPAPIHPRKSVDRDKSRSRVQAHLPPLCPTFLWGSRAKSGEESEWFLPEYATVGRVIKIGVAKKDKGPNFAVALQIASLAA